MIFSGTFTALVTPFKNGKVDEESYRNHIEWQISEGVNGLVPCGTTGESATLSHDEHEQVIKICIEQAKKRVPVLAGAGSNNTKEAVSLVRFAKEVGADGVLLITPYYNKPTQEGLFQHYKYIASEVSIPIIAYNVPGRTGVNLLPSTLGRMFREIPEICGVKEATGNLQQVADIIEECGDKLCVLSGDDFTVLPTLAVGGHGVISVVSNIAPKLMSSLCVAYKNGDLKTAQKIHYQLNALNRVLFVETNPIPVKTGLHLMGRMTDEFRLPLVSLQPESLTKLKNVMQKSGLI
ncbi:4-hydroxy-tetrahydrodipicolinate synthase [Desulfovibrio litoralis]|uniref:4-hydroxy-tetrahydrodipicolinate synthase n=1 Tax=Desulfovibrio litoralis DSM 11393 TaxID=1121455 RepID=A0A1M7SL28_9BACT|nr:4-hydroxy-tetrahydrodipicolinate synthase [Desulfovibrio litoralis]SHN59182.1 dihydrodipicolinate synthase [Desulfovibrio litoralis DSM 11393]